MTEDVTPSAGPAEVPPAAPLAPPATDPAGAAAGEPGAPPTTSGTEASAPPTPPTPPTPGLGAMLKAGWTLVFYPVEAPVKVARQVGRYGQMRLGITAIIATSALFPIYQPRGAGITNYLLDVLLSLGGLAVITAGFYVVRRWLFGQERVAPADDLYLTGVLVMPIAIAALIVGVLGWLKLDLLFAPVLLGAAKVVGLCATYRALPDLVHIEGRGAVVLLALVIGVANLVFACGRGMGLLL